MTILTESLALTALGHFFDYSRNQVFPNVHLYDWESDLVVVTPAGYLWEVEVKTTLQDWKADSSKSKWKSLNWPKVNRFY